MLKYIINIIIIKNKRLILIFNCLFGTFLHSLACECIGQ